MTSVDFSIGVSVPLRAPELSPRWLRDLAHVSDRMLHPRRRRAAEAQIRKLRPRVILFVCHGNICRSPFAAAVLARCYAGNTRRRVIATSAGFMEPGRKAPPRAINAASRRGVDLSVHRSEVMNDRALRAAELVVVMSDDQARAISHRLRRGRARLLVLGDLDPAAVTRRTIADPWGGPESLYDASYHRIERCVGELARILNDISANA